MPTAGGQKGGGRTPGQLGCAEAVPPARCSRCNARRLVLAVKVATSIRCVRVQSQRALREARLHYTACMRKTAHKGTEKSYMTLVPSRRAEPVGGEHATMTCMNKMALANYQDCTVIIRRNGQTRGKITTPPVNRRRMADNISSRG